MNLIDSASLVVTPNGYKTSKLYSIIPSDGTGDMTFARTGDTATRVNPSGLIAPINANIPRLDYLGSTCPKLLLEPQRTNLIIRSEEFDNASWTKTFATVTSNSIISPDGTQDADKLVEDTSAGQQHRINIATTSAAGTYTLSVYVKGTERDIQLRIGSIGGYFNVTTGTFSLDSTVTGTMTNVGNSWYRCTITLTTANTNEFCRFNLLQKNTINATYNGDGTSGVFLWGAQLEAGAFVTSYIPTTTASVTRNADSCEKTSATALIGQTEGTMFVNLEKLILNMGSGTTCVPLQISDGTNNNRIFIGQVNNANKFQFYVIVGGTVQLNLQTIDFNLGRSKIAVGYKSNNFVIYVNGVQVYTSSSISIPTCSKINIGGIGATTEVVHPMSSVALWKTRLQNAELATLTTL
jgi:hypothetical protein